jgi:4-amino-4-deoxychorismate lyase
MSLLIESIKLLDGKFFNLFYHQQRMLRSLSSLCGVTDDFNLQEFLAGLDFPLKGLFKCRIVYDDSRKDVEFVPYQPRSIKSLRVVEHDRISYDLKFTDRELIDQLFALRKECDDILISKKGLVTDSSFSNIIFRRGNEWFTPRSPLLKGTQRQKLVDENKIIEQEIKTADIRSFDTFKVINAMFEADAPEVDVKYIFP